ncbi:glycosyltransferase family protein [Chryseobacterium sp. RG1]|uniref:Glycosyltransferase family protein n=1 Tax=Chryseobacterium tagetis TaxID=2801334 RepID=A0ABS7ZYM0_9FLAO|nr:glycosyltransferase [Chryseobacterium tagetis]MCA6066823.1 glycosyltransferase family protein [Chryseobacterium tagetis]
MLSIIISTYKSDLFQQLSQNIAETIGSIDYEIIPINNPGIMGICEAYNLGAGKANFSNFLFLHEDVKFHTENWGLILTNHLSEKEAGVIGVAGSSYVPKTPSGWHLPDNKYNYLNIIQRDAVGKTIHEQINHTKKSLIFAVDGVFLAVTKKVFEEFKFNTSLKGFHGYDSDFSLRISKKYTNYFVPDILLEHFSIGNPDKIWFNNNILVRKFVGNNYNSDKDIQLEGNLYMKFLYQFYTYYPANIKNIFLVLRFLPFNLSKKKYSEILKFFKIIIRYPKAFYKA